MSDTTHEFVPYAIVPHDIPDDIVETFMLMHGTPQELADIQGAQRDIRDHLPKLNRVISKLAYLGPDATPADREKASRIAYSIINVLNRMVVTEQLEALLSAGDGVSAS